MLPLLAINAIVMMAVSLGLWLMPSISACPPQAVVHITFALGILPMILAAIVYFAPVLTRGSGAPNWLQALPLMAWLGAGIILAGFSGMLGLVFASNVSVMFSGSAAAVIMIWMMKRSRRMLGSPHPCFAWYLAALAFLGTALLAVPAMAQWPSERAMLRLFHLHVNLLGFVGLTAIGTLQVLLPTAAGYADGAVAGRLSKDLKFACGGVLLMAIGSACIAEFQTENARLIWAKSIALMGAAMYLIAPLRMGIHWCNGCGRRIASLNGATPSLLLSCIGLVGLVLAGVGHMLGFLPGRDASPGYIVAFLLPLVSGAVTQLLPVWLRPGSQREWHEQLRGRLGRLAGLRALLMVSGGFAFSLGWHAGLWVGLAGLLLFAIVAVSALLEPSIRR
ncbi:MAG: hypothetical protein WC073_16325 [Sterolibacterium sp.]